MNLSNAMLPKSRILTKLSVAFISMATILVGTPAPASATGITLTNPELTVTRGSDFPEMTVSFTEDPAASSYTLRLYSAIDNFASVRGTYTDFHSGVTIGTGACMSAVGTDPLCWWATQGKNVRFTIEAIPAAGNFAPSPAESPKSIEYGFAGLTGVRCNSTSWVGSAFPNEPVGFKIGSIACASATSGSAQIYSSVDSYATVQQTVTGIPTSSCLLYTSPSPRDS